MDDPKVDMWPNFFSNSMQGLKSAILAMFRRGLGWPCPVSAALKNPLLDLEKYFCLGLLLMMEGKIRKDSFF